MREEWRNEKRERKERERERDFSFILTLRSSGVTIA